MITKKFIITVEADNSLELFLQNIISDDLNNTLRHMGENYPDDPETEEPPFASLTNIVEVE